MHCVEHFFGDSFYDIFVSNGVDTELPNCCKLHHIVHFPIGYIALKFGCSASSVFYISIFFTLIAGFVRFSVLSESDWLFIEETYKGCFISCSRSDGSFFAVACFHKISFP